MVGHDWGALIAWSLALQHPHRLVHLAVLNVPHPAVLQRKIRTNPRQLAEELVRAVLSNPVAA